MTSLVKLQRAFDLLKKVISKPLDEFTNQKFKIAPWITITELVCKSNDKSILLPFAITSLLQLLEDADSNRRLVIDECLNRIIRNSMSNSNHVAKILLALLKVLGKNTDERSLRAALWRFGQLSHFIRPQKGKMYVKTLMPIILKISQRKDESIHHTLQESLPNVLKNIGLFTADKDIKALLKIFVRNLSSHSVEIRRSGASCIVAVCKYSRKPMFFFSYSLVILTDSLQECKNFDKYEKFWIQGCFSGIYQLIPHIKVQQHEVDCSVSEKFLQIFELSLYYAQFSDHNVVTSALETFNQLLQVRNKKFITIITKENSSAELSFRKTENYGSTLSISVLSDISSIGSTIGQTVNECFPEFKAPMEDVMVVSNQYSSNSPINFKEIRTKAWINEQEVEDDNSISSSLNMNVSHFANSDEENCSNDVTFSIQSPQWFNENKTILDNDDYSVSEAISDSIANISGISNLNLSNIVPVELDIGELSDAEVIPVNYSARFLLAMFLLNSSSCGSKPVRVSVKSLALKCFSQIMRIHPHSAQISLQQSQSTYQGFSNLLELVLSCMSDNDQQIRGTVQFVVANFIVSALYSDNYMIVPNNCRAINPELLTKLVKILMQGLKDMSSQVIKHSLDALSICLMPILQTPHYKIAIPLLEQLFLLVNNPYWVIKTKIIEIIDGFCYEIMYFISGNDNVYQNRILEKILMVLLVDADARIRASSAESLSIFVEKSYSMFDNQFKPVFLSHMMKETTSYTTGGFMQLLLERRILRIIHRLYKILSSSSVKYEIAGCCQALHVLVLKYGPVTYPKAWQCDSIGTWNRNEYCSLYLFDLLLSLITTSNIALNFEVHIHILSIISQLFTALCQNDMNYCKNYDFIDETTTWSFLRTSELRGLAECYLQHLTRLANLFNDVILGINVRNNSPPECFQIPVALPFPVDQLIPTKTDSQIIIHCKKQSFNKSRWRSERKIDFSQYNHLPVYMELRNVLKAAFMNYEVTLKPEASEKFIRFHNSLLESLSLVFDFTTAVEVDPICPKILLFLYNVSALSPAQNIRCVKQLLKSVFGTNSISDILLKQCDNKEVGRNQLVSDFCLFCFDDPCKQIFREISAERVAGSTHLLKKESIIDGSGLSFPNKFGKRVISVHALSSYIKLFEPNCIQSLRLYTVSSDANLQSEVLSLLSSLIQLKVNYCLLDSELIFLEFILSQFQLMEEERLTNMDTLLPSMLNFFIYLASEKHSKPVMTIPKIIQLCDSLIASIQASSHSLIAIELVTLHVFTKSPLFIISSEIKELEAQRDVLFAMLLKLIRNYQSFPLLSLILENSHDESKLKRSDQIIDVYFTALEEDRCFDRCVDKITTYVLNLFSSLHPSSIDVGRLWKIILTLYSTNYGRNSNQWLFVCESLLIVLLKECNESRLLLLVESSLNHPALIKPEDTDPLCVGTGKKCLRSPQFVFSRILILILKEILRYNLNSIDESSGISKPPEQVQELLSSYCQLLSVILTLDDFDNVRGEFIKIYYDNTDTDNELQACIFDIKLMINRLQHLQPIMSLKIMHVIACDSERSSNEWKISDVAESCFVTESLKHGTVLLICKFCKDKLISSPPKLSKFLKLNLKVLLLNLNESSVRDFFIRIHEFGAASLQLIEILKDMCLTDLKDELMTLKILRCLNLVSNEVGVEKMLFLIQADLLRTASTAVVSASLDILTCSLNFLKTIEKSDQKIQDYLSPEQAKVVHKCMNELENPAFNCLKVEYNDLLSKCYDLQITLPENEVVINNKINLATSDGTWYLELLKNRCSRNNEVNYLQIATMMSKLSFNQILNIQLSPEFNRKMLNYCISIGSQKEWDSPNDDVSSNVSELLLASMRTLFITINKLNELLPPNQIYVSWNGNSDEEELLYRQRLNLLFTEENIHSIYELIPAVNSYVKTAKRLIRNSRFVLFSEDNSDCLISFVILCLKFSCWSILSRDKKSMSISGLECVASVIQIENIVNKLKPTHLESIVCCTYHLVKEFTKDALNLQTSSSIFNDKSYPARYSAYVVSILIDYIIMKNSCSISSSKFFKYLKELLRNLSYSPIIYGCVRIPLEIWKYVSEEEIVLGECVTLNNISENLLQDCDILQNFISRFIFAGWTNRQQFEETWMTLLSALNLFQEHDTSELEVEVLPQIHALSISGVTSLLVQTLYYPNPGNKTNFKVFHISRNALQFRHTRWLSRLSKLSHVLKTKSEIEGQHTVILFDHLSTNLERLHDRNVFNFNQISVDYILKSLDSSNIAKEDGLENVSLYYKGLESMRKQRQQTIELIGIDINSCVYFLMDFYSRWMRKPDFQPIQVVLETVNSLSVISDLFLESSQYVWLLESCLLLWKRYSKENEAVWSYLTVLICKAAAISVPKVGFSDIESRKLIVKIFKSSLESSSPLIRSVSLHGLLYLLENIFSLLFTDNHESIDGQFRDDILSITGHHVLDNLNVDTFDTHDENTICCVVSIACYLIENKAREDISDSIITRMFDLSIKACKLKCLKVYRTLIQGLYNLILLNDFSLKQHYSELNQLIKKISSTDCTLDYSLCILQLLMAVIYTSENLIIGRSVCENEQFDTEGLINKMDRICIFFDRIKQCDEYEAKLISAILSQILCDFYSPSEILNKIIQEILSPQQPHCHIIAEIVFQVFQNAVKNSQSDLITDWVISISSNFSNFPAHKSIFLFTTFFVSACTNEWLTGSFALLTSACISGNLSDRKTLFFVSAIHFYSQLQTENQKNKWRKIMQCTREKLSASPYIETINAVLNYSADNHSI